MNNLYFFFVFVFVVKNTIQKPEVFQSAPQPSKPFTRTAWNAKLPTLVITTVVTHTRVMNRMYWVKELPKQEYFRYTAINKDWNNWFDDKKNNPYPSTRILAWIERMRFRYRGELIQPNMLSAVIHIPHNIIVLHPDEEIMEIMLDESHHDEFENYDPDDH